jgi:NTE family protein
MRAALAAIPAIASMASIVAATMLVGCASATRFENEPLTTAQPNPERRTIDVSHPDRPLILVAISGGGSRAAALGWVVLSELDRHPYVQDGATRSLADDVGVVSSVSGGSVIAASFAVDGTAGLPSFESKFLQPDNMEALAVSITNPFSLIATASRGAPRTDQVEALFDERLFHHRTFKDLNQPGHPYLVMNATDMSMGERFAFTPNLFDDICSDLDREPISVGVGASSAVPIVLAPIAFRNHTAPRDGPPCAARPATDWPAFEVLKKTSPWIDLDAYKRARYENDLRHGLPPAGWTGPPPEVFRPIDYVYLVDGGLADNLGVHGLMQVFPAPEGPRIVAPANASDTPHTILEAVNRGEVTRLVVLVINARAESKSTTDMATSPERPGIGAMFGAVTSIPIDATTASVQAQMDDLLDQVKNAAKAARDNAALRGVAAFQALRVYGIEVDFDQLRGDAALRDQAKSVPTSWTITPANLEVMKRAGTLLLDQHPCFQRLLLDLGAQGAPTGATADVVRLNCPTGE